METAMTELPEECIEHIMSLTTPRDVCGLSSVSRGFKSAGESDAVWDKFLPPDTHAILSHYGSASLTAGKSNKELYFTLSENPILIHNGKMSFSLDKWSGKKCYMISARALRISMKNDPRYWKWITLPESRFGDATELIFVDPLEIRGRIEACMLSPSTKYNAYLVYKLTADALQNFGFQQPVQVTVGRKDYGFDYQQPDLEETMEKDANKKSAFLIPQKDLRELIRQRETSIQNYRRAMSLNQEINEAIFPSERGDGWLEVELGEFYCGEDEEGELEMICCEFDDTFDVSKHGLVVQGIEVRPKRK